MNNIRFYIVDFDEMINIMYVFYENSIKSFSVCVCVDHIWWLKMYGIRILKQTITKHDLHTYKMHHNEDNEIKKKPIGT